MVIDVTTPLKAEEDDFSLEDVDGMYLVPGQQDDDDVAGAAGPAIMPNENSPIR